MRKSFALVVLAGLVAVSTAHAARPYSMSGCGLGTLVMGKDGNQILSATTNGTSYSQLFGITSGTSNCTDSGTVAKANEIPMFVEANKLALANDIARGSGETVANLSQVLGCENAASLATELQKNYKKIFPSSSAPSETVTQSIMDVVKSDAKLAGSCTGVS